MKTWKNILLATFCALILGCSSSNSDDYSSTDDDDNDSTGSSAPLYLTLESNLRNSETYTTEGSCEATSGTPHATCSISIEELTLYYSNLKFTIGTGSRNYCEQIVFRPFRYKRSNSATFAIGGSSNTLDCSLPNSEIDALCYGGLASSIVTSFPKNTAMYFLMENDLSNTFEAKSSDERSNDDADYSIYTNANATNNLASGARGTGLTVGGGDDVDYVANSYVDNLIGCYDKWGNLDYSITLTIRDEDETGPGLTPDEFWDWFD